MSSGANSAHGTSSTRQLVGPSPLVVTAGTAGSGVSNDQHDQTTDFLDRLLLVTGDKQLLQLGVYEGTRLLSSRQFLDELSRWDDT